MTKITQLNNPLGLDDRTILDYLKLQVVYGEAKYQCALVHSPRSISNLLHAKAKLQRFKSELEHRSDTLIFQEILPLSLIEEQGYVFWAGTNIRTKREDYLIGKISHQGLERNFQYHIVEVNSLGFNGLLTFENYAGGYQAIVFDGTNIYAIKDVIKKKGDEIMSCIKKGILVREGLDQIVNL